MGRYRMHDRKMNQWIEGLVVAVHRRNLDGLQIFIAADQIEILASPQHWGKEISVGIGLLKKRMENDDSWRSRFSSAAASAKSLLVSDALQDAAKALHESVHDIAINGEWRPLQNMYGYDDIINPGIIRKYFLDKKELAKRYPELSDEALERAHEHSLRIHDALTA